MGNVRCLQKILNENRAKSKTVSLPSPSAVEKGKITRPRRRKRLRASIRTWPRRSLARRRERAFPKAESPLARRSCAKANWIATGHNKARAGRRPVTHGETDCLRNAGRLGSFRGCTLYSTLMPCYFCAGAAVQFGIRKVVVGESRNFPGAPEFMRAPTASRVVDLDLPECYEMIGTLHSRESEHNCGNEDIGVD